MILKYHCFLTYKKTRLIINQTKNPDEVLDEESQSDVDQADKEKIDLSTC